MSRKQAISVAVAGLLLALTVACGAAEEDPASGPQGASARAAQGDTGADTERMIVRVVDMHLVVRDPTETMDAVTQMTLEMDGFIVSSSRSGGERDTVVTVSLRVPTERTDEAVQRLRDLSCRMVFGVAGGYRGIYSHGEAGRGRGVTS